LARQIRWVTTAPTFLAYPPTTTKPELPELRRACAWFDVSGNQLRVLRAPTENESLPVNPFVEDAAARLNQLEDERENVSLRLREVVRDRGATAAVNARKKELKVEISEAARKLDGPSALREGVGASDRGRR
jgi:hypothetical protein